MNVRRRTKWTALEKNLVQTVACQTGECVAEAGVFPAAEEFRLKKAGLGQQHGRCRAYGQRQLEETRSPESRLDLRERSAPGAERVDDGIRRHVFGDVHAVLFGDAAEVLADEHRHAALVGLSEKRWGFASQTPSGGRGDRWLGSRRDWTLGSSISKLS